MSSLLPNETLFAIFENLQPGVLQQVACVSLRFRAIAERILYSNITIVEAVAPFNPVRPPDRTSRCCETLLQYPHLLDVVRTLHVRWQTDPTQPREMYRSIVQRVLTLLNCTLRKLTQLEALDLALGLIGAPIDAETILFGCSFPSLRLLALCGVGRGNLPAKFHPSSLAIERFLSSTPSIQHLRLADYYEPIYIAPRDLPVLTTFRGTAVAAASILPGRPVQCLALTGQEYITDNELAMIVRGSVRIRRLDLSAISVTPNLLRDISRRLPDVEFLKFKLALRHTLHHSFTGISILAGLTPVLRAFPKLYQLDLSSTPVSNMGLGSSLEEASLCTTWARGCPSLRQVIFPSKTEWRLSPDHTWVSQSTPRYSRS